MDLLDKAVFFWAGEQFQYGLEMAYAINVLRITKKGFFRPTGILVMAKADAICMEISHVGELLISGSGVFIALAYATWGGVRLQGTRGKRIYLLRGEN